MEPSDARLARRALSAILLLTALVTLPTLRYDFVFDDHPLIEHNAQLRSDAELRPLLTRNHWSHHLPGKRGNYYRPVMMLNYRLTCEIAGPSPFAFHLVSVLQHLICVALVFQILLRLRLDLTATTAASLVFALHPSRAEVVAWVAGANSSFASAQTLAVVLLTLVALDNESRGRRLALTAGAMLLTLTAVLSKESAATLPGQVGLAVFVAGGVARSVPARLKTAAATATPVALVVAAGLGLRRLMLGYLSLSLTELETGALLRNIPRAALGHLELLALPVARGPFYSLGPDPKLSLLWALATTALILGLVALSLWPRESRRAVGFGWCWLGGTILPVLNLRALPRGEILHDRFLYLPGLGFAVVLGALLALAMRRARLSPRNTVAALVGLALSLAGLTLRELPFWRDDRSLWRRAVEVAPDNPTAQLNQAVVLAGDGQTARAERLLRGLDRDATPTSVRVSALDTLAVIAIRRRDFVTAEATLDQLLRLEPLPRPLLLVKLATVQLARSRLEGARETLNRLLETAPSTPGAHYLVARYHLADGRPDRAAEACRRELERDPSHRGARRLLDAIRSRR